MYGNSPTWKPLFRIYPGIHRGNGALSPLERDMVPADTMISQSIKTQRTLSHGGPFG